MMVKWTPYTDGIRKGYFNCLLSLINRYEKINMTKKEILIDLKAIIKDIDTFIEYGDDCQLFFTEWKQSKTNKQPTKGKIVPPGTNYPKNEALLQILKDGGMEQYKE